MGKDFSVLQTTEMHQSRYRVRCFHYRIVFLYLIPDLGRTYSVDVIAVLWLPGAGLADRVVST